MCGELAIGRHENGQAGGSSPRVRGTLRRSPQERCRRRIIPACAGNSVLRSQPPAASPDHPRVCGELGDATAVVAYKGGSSPRVRGTRGFSRNPQARRRIIPACAGNSSGSALTRPHSADHPRVCGELSAAGLRLARITGSSPRVRGTRKVSEVLSAERRIIPACAGNSTATLIILSMKTDHPRVCGELLAFQRPDDIHVGSSPRVRGTPPQPLSLSLLLRIIPACAGNSDLRAFGFVALADHPRVCGELVGPILQIIEDVGSSPRVRGTLDLPPRLQVRFRIIPACAGNSRSGLARKVPRPDHPRVCGELGALYGSGAVLGGSSPRVRGTPHADFRRPVTRRIIPACAGNSSCSLWP